MSTGRRSRGAAPWAVAGYGLVASGSVSSSADSAAMPATPAAGRVPAMRTSAPPCEPPTSATFAAPAVRRARTAPLMSAISPAGALAADPGNPAGPDGQSLSPLQRWSIATTLKPWAARLAAYGHHPHLPSMPSSGMRTTPRGPLPARMAASRTPSVALIVVSWPGASGKLHSWPTGPVGGAVGAGGAELDGAAVAWVALACPLDHWPVAHAPAAAAITRTSKARRSGPGRRAARTVMPMRRLP